MEVPPKVSSSVLGRKAPVSAVVFFESTEVALKGIGGPGHIGMSHEVKQIGESFEQHAPGTH